MKLAATILLGLFRSLNAQEAAQTCFYDTTFCVLARSARTDADCDAMSAISDSVCPSQTQVCDRAFNLTAYCQTSFGGCTSECTQYMNTCCETSCCEATCLQDDLICRLFDVGECSEIRSEVCPCRSETRTTQEYCQDLVGSTDCVDDCIEFVEGCCNLRDGDLRLVDTSNSTSLAGEVIRGKLQVYQQGKWGTICGYSFDRSSAEVACSQLGYSTAGKSFA